MRTVPKMLCPLALLSQAPQNLSFRTWSYSQKLLEIKLSIVEGETWEHMLVRGKHVLSIFSQFSLHPSLIHCNSQSGHQEEIFYMNSLGKVAPISVSFSAWLQFQLQLFWSCCVTVELVLEERHWHKWEGWDRHFGQSQGQSCRKPSQSEPQQVPNEECLKNHAICLGIWVLI